MSQSVTAGAVTRWDRRPPQAESIHPLLVDLLGLLLHGGGGSPLQVFAALPERQVLAFGWTAAEKKPPLETGFSVWRRESGRAYR